MPKGAQTQRQSHLERLELLKKNKMEAGLVSDRFPGVARIVFRMTYYQRGGRSVLMTRTMNFVPSDYAYFQVDCSQRDCMDGGFNLLPVVSALIKDRKKTARGKLCCDGKLTNSAATPNHASIDYEVIVETAKV